MGGVFGRVIGRTIIAHHAGESSEWSSIDAVNSELTMILTTSTADAEHAHTHTRLAAHRRHISETVQSHK